MRRLDWPLSEGSRVSAGLIATGLFAMGLAALVLGDRHAGLRD